MFHDKQKPWTCRGNSPHQMAGRLMIGGCVWIKDERMAWLFGARLGPGGTGERYRKSCFSVQRLPAVMWPQFTCWFSVCRGQCCVTGTSGELCPVLLTILSLIFGFLNKSRASGYVILVSHASRVDTRFVLSYSVLTVSMVIVLSVCGQ